MIGRQKRVRVVCVSKVRRDLLDVTGTALPHRDFDDPQSSAVGLWQFWPANDAELVLVAKRELAHLKSGRPLD